MRSPVRSESEAFGAALVLAFALVVSVLIGAWVSPWAGVAVCALVVVGALAWWAARAAPDPSWLRDAERIGHQRPGRDRHRILLVANAALSGDGLRDELARLGGQRPVLEVLAPVLQSRTHFVTTDIDHETEQARRRLRQTLDWAEQHGIQASGVVGDPIDPLAGIGDELRRYDVDEVVVATHPLERANWIEAGILEQLRGHLGVPVRHVVVEDRRPMGAPRG